ncbi:MAG: glycosyltransferase [Phycisphaerales bacterium]|nr:glycosyltransferase [Phycisphaerales bacterium]MCI0629792.1 glycosyltransferase [Phycisphaerales bacterium]MCI0675530.1 glycosyltransferase [Phycisphaerales bacterium]
MNQPILSVVMPVYNSRRYLAKAVESILNQTFRDFEFIIVDDGSNDGSSEILERYKRQDDRIALIRQTNGGVSAASNRGIALARGEFLARMDHDDVSMPHRFQAQIDYLRAHPDCVAVGSPVLMIDSEGLPIRRHAVPQTHDEIESALVNPTKWAMFHPTMMARADVMRDLGGYSLEFCNLEDLDVFFKLAERGRLANLPDVLVHYRQHFASICYTKSMDHPRLHVRILEEASKRRGADLTLQLDRQYLELKPMPKPRAGATRWAYEIMWAWWALDSRYVETARRHALKAFRIRPLSPATWLLLWCVLRGH